MDRLGGRTVKAIVLMSSAFAVVTCPGCDGGNLPVSLPPTAVQVARSLSGQVFELTPGGRLPAANVPVHVAVMTTSGCAPPCMITTGVTYENTTTGPDGRYSFPQLLAGSAVVLAHLANYRQVCGAGIELGAASQLDVEITSTANPQLSPTMPPLRVTGQVYEITPAGRVGVSGAWIGMDHHLPDSPFLTVFTDAEGRYAACGIPPNWPIGFDTGATGYEFAGQTVWHYFRADTTLDIEMRRVP